MSSASASAGDGGVGTGPQRLDALLSHPDRRDVDFVDGGENAPSFFRHRGKRVPGLLAPLKRALWPRYDYDTANRGTARRFARRDPTLRRPADGAKRGTRVHLQLETLTNYGTSAVRKKVGRAGIDVYTKKFIAWLQHERLRPVVSELAVYDAALGIATSADLLCLDRCNRVVLIETKTGYYSSWHRSCVPMSGPRLSRPVSDSPCNQALMQLLFTKRMIEGYGTRVDRAAVVRVTPDGVEPEKLDPRVEVCGDLIAAHVIESQQRQRRRRGRARQ